MKTLEHRAKKRRKQGESGEMANKKMDENREKKKKGKEKSRKRRPSIVLLSPAPCKSRSFSLQ